MGGEFRNSHGNIIPMHKYKAFYKRLDNTWENRTGHSAEWAVRLRKHEGVQRGGYYPILAAEPFSATETRYHRLSCAVSVIRKWTSVQHGWPAAWNASNKYVARLDKQLLFLHSNMQKWFLIVFSHFHILFDLLLLWLRLILNISTLEVFFIY